jgi:predicted HicB family RNase H-like nuclease
MRAPFMRKDSRNTTRKLLVRFPPDVVRALKARADQEGRSIEALISEAVNNLLKKWK